jgi:subtilisin family serine protease
MYKDVNLGSSQKEILPYGIQMVVGRDGKGPGPSSLLGSDVVVCILDTGIYTNHSDLIKNSFSGCTKATAEGSMCRFYPFNVPEEPHGTHVSGTIAAIRGNGRGVVGILPSGADIVGSNVLPGRGSGLLSLTLEALLLCEAEVDARKAKGKLARAVVNMSFGTSEKSPALESMINRMNRRGDILFVASAGNEQVSSPGQVIYPAGFASAISVGAVNCNKKLAAFSQRNHHVSLVAPGVDILSTTPPEKVDLVKLQARTAAGFKSILHVEAVAYSGFGTITAAEIVHCGLGTVPCVKGKGKACLISRGRIPFGCKARNAQLGGCTAVLLFNTENPPCTPLVGATLETDECSPADGKSFPLTVALSQKDGKMLKTWIAKKPGSKVTLSVKKSRQTTMFTTNSGTSMAAPHVTGIAARIWAAFPKCQSFDIRKALELGAKDIGQPGKDSHSGYGLVDLNGAYYKLQHMACAQPEVADVPTPPEEGQDISGERPAPEASPPKDDGGYNPIPPS